MDHSAQIPPELADVQTMIYVFICGFIIAAVGLIAWGIYLLVGYVQRRRNIGLKKARKAIQDRTRTMKERQARESNDSFFDGYMEATNVLEQRRRESPTNHIEQLTRNTDRPSGYWDYYNRDTHS